ncbi:MAG: two-component system, NarL family, response regulator DegU [Actinomycetota bacterium]|jgi:DNA-binding NarL/FixJ family response regulator|nr:two-component system, NarL family, response regulator DegU [Actinomycetota bacterium]
MTRLLLADDHRMLREGLRRSLEDQGFDVVGEASDGHEAFRLAVELTPDVILMDVTMPVLDGVEATRLIRGAVPGAAIVMLTMHADGDVMARALQAGAIGYLVKDCAIDEVVAAVRMAAQDDGVLSPGLASSMLAEMQRGNGGRETNGSVATAPVISAREEEVLQLFADGLSLPEVAAQLFISVKTVKNHLASIYAKLDARDRTQAVLRAVRMGIIRLSPPEP